MCSFVHSLLLVGLSQFYELLNTCNNLQFIGYSIRVMASDEGGAGGGSGGNFLFFFGTISLCLLVFLMIELNCICLLLVGWLAGRTHRPFACESGIEPFRVIIILLNAIKTIRTENGNV